MPQTVRTESSCPRRGFTLVELLVVIAIIGMLVALLLPAVNSAREAARRTQCMNQVRSMGTAILNLESALSTFPSGGIHPWPKIERYSTNGRPFGPPKQGLSWAFQILPFLEEGAVHGLTTTEQIANSPVALYFCPSRRRPTSYTDVQGSNGPAGATYWLMDYAALNPIPSRRQIGDVGFEVMTKLEDGRPSRGCRDAYAFWGTRTYQNDHDPQPKSDLGIAYTGFNGAIVRSSYYVQNNGQVTDLNYDPVVKVKKFKDGLSKTSLIGEKRIRVGEMPGSAYDDRGWSDGWDLDTVSSTACQPTADSTEEREGFADPITPGSAHAAGLNVVFCDNSVHFITYGIDLETWNSLAHRNDGQVTNFP